MFFPITTIYDSFSVFYNDDSSTNRSSVSLFKNSQSWIQEPAKEVEDADSDGSSGQPDDDKATRLTLMEQILLLGLKDREVCKVHH